MPGPVTMRILGLSEMDAALGELSKATAKNVLRRVGKKALQPMADRANQLAPDDPDTPGGLHESYVVGTKLNSRQTSLAKKEPKDFVTVYMGTDDPAGVMQEFGTVTNPPQPHVRPAFNDEAEATIHRFADGMKPEIDKSVARARAKALKA